MWQFIYLYRRKNKLQPGSRAGQVVWQLFHCKRWVKLKNYHHFRIFDPKRSFYSFDTKQPNSPLALRCKRQELACGLSSHCSTGQAKSESAPFREELRGFLSSYVRKRTTQIIPERFWGLWLLPAQTKPHAGRYGNFRRNISQIMFFTCSTSIPKYREDMFQLGTLRCNVTRFW